MSDPAGANDFVPELRLEAPEPANVQVVARAETRKHYQHPYAHYAKQWGLKAKDSERALKRWVKRGRESDPPDWPPFDEPHLLAAWWRRNMTWAPPDWAVMLEQLGDNNAEVPQVLETPKAVERQEPGVPAEKREEMPPAKSMPEGLDLDDLPEDAGDAEKELWKLANGFKIQMSQAMRDGDMTKFWPPYNEYSKILKQLRMWEKDRLQKKLASGQALDVAKMSEVLTTMFGTVSKAYLQGMLRLAKKLNPRLTDEQVRALVYPERDEVFRGLKEGRFAMAVPAEVAA